MTRITRSPIRGLLAILCLGPMVLPVTAGPVEREAEIVDLTGDVLLRKSGEDWTEARVGQKVGRGHQIHTGLESRISLRLPDGSAAVVKELSVIRVSRLLVGPGSRSVQLRLDLGELEAQVSPKDSARSDFSVQTPVATASVRGTKIHRVRYSPGRGMDVDLASGRLLLQTLSRRYLMAGRVRAQVPRIGSLLTRIDLSQRTLRIPPDIGLTVEEAQQVIRGSGIPLVVPRGSETTFTAPVPGGSISIRLGSP